MAVELTKDESKAINNATVCGCGCLDAVVADIIELRLEAAPKVEITQDLNRPTRCKVWREGVLVFDGFTPPF